MRRKNAGTAINGSPGDESNEIPDYEGEKILFNADIDEIGPAKMLIEIRKMSHRCLTETEMDQPDHYVSLLWKPWQIGWISPYMLESGFKEGTKFFWWITHLSFELQWKI